MMARFTSSIVIREVSIVSISGFSSMLQPSRMSMFSLRILSTSSKCSFHLSNTWCAPLLADIFLYSHEADFILSLLSTWKKKLASQFNFTYRSITLILIIIWVRCIPLNLRSKTRQRATPLLPTWIYYCRSEGTVSCALPSTTNVTISTSISQTFRSWAATLYLHQHIAFLSHSSYGLPGLALLMNVLF